MVNRNVRTLMFQAIPSIYALSLIGCAANSTPEQMQRESYAQHQQDQDQIQGLNIEVRRLKERIERLESSLQSEREQVARTEQERQEVRDALLRFKIGLEQFSSKRVDRPTGERPLSDLQEENARLHERLDEAKRRFKELLHQVQRLLETS